MSHCHEKTDLHTRGNCRTARCTGPTYQATRRETNLTQEQAAKGIGISAEFYARIERGKALPGLENLVKIADFFKVRVDYLIGQGQVEAMNLVKLAASRKIEFLTECARKDDDVRRMIILVLKMGADRGVSGHAAILKTART